MSSYVWKNMNKHLLQDTWFSTLIHIAQQAQYGGYIFQSFRYFMSSIIHVLGLAKTNHYPIWKQPARGKKKWLYPQTLTSNILSTRQMYPI